MKKLFSIAAIVALLGSIVPTTFGATYSDELQGAYDYAYGMGITTQSSIDSANMYGNLIRSHMAKMMVNYAKEMGKTADNTATCNFTDIANESAELQGYMIEACQMGLMGVGITAFRPNDTVTRGEFGTVLSRVLWGDANNGGEPYYVNHLNALKDAGVMTKIDNPTMKEVRGYVMLMMQRADESNVANTKPAVCSTPENVLACSLLGLDSCPAECKGEEEVVVKPGFVTISRVGSVDTHNVAYNAVAKKIGTIKLTAGDNDTTVQSIVITRSGLGMLTDIEGIRLSKNGVDATDMRKPTSSTQAATLRFVPALVMKAGSSTEFDVLVTLNAGKENSRHDFAVTAVNVNDGNSTGTPFNLSSINTTSYSVGTVTPSFGGTNSIKAGEKDKLITSVRLQPNTTAKIAGFTLSKTAGEDFTKVIDNVKAYYNSQMVGTVTVTTDKVVVSGLDIERLNGENATIELKADGIYIGSGNSVSYELKANDVVAFEKNTNERMRSAYLAAQNLTVDGVDMVLTNKLTSSKTVAPGTSSVELYRAELTSNSEVEVTDYTLSFVTGGSDVLSGFIDGEVTAYVNGAEYTLTGAGKTFTATADKFIVDKKNPALIRVVGNLRSNAPTPKDYKMSFRVNTVKNISDNVSFKPGGVDAGGAITTVDTGRFTLTRPSNIPSNKTVLEGSNTELAYFNLRASSEDQVLTKVTVSSTTGFDVYASRIELVQGTTVVKSITNNLNTGTLVFDGFSRTLAKDTTVPFTVRVQLKQGEAANLGLPVTLTIGTGGLAIARSADTSAPTTTTSPNLVANTYQIASNVPTVALPTKLNNETTLAISNTSNYDVVVTSVKFDVTRNIINNQFANWGTPTAATVNFKDGSVVVATGTAPGQTSVTLVGADQILVGSDSVNRIIELVDSANTVTPDLYTVTVRELTFNYVDRTDSSKVSDPITETYNIAK